MSEYLASRIKKPHIFRMKNTGKKEAAKPRFVIGFDSEADTSTQGQPMLFQFSLPGMPEEDTLLVEVADTEYAGLRTFLNFVDKYCNSRDVQYLIYVWNLSYEITQIFHDLPRHVRLEDQVRIAPTWGDRPYNWEIELSNWKRQIVRFISTKDAKIVVTMLDGRAFYNTSLDKGAKMLGLGEKFKDDSLDRSLFTRADLKDETFLKYARRDAYITRRIGEYISRQHDIYKIPTTMSAPHLAATVFKTHFLEGMIIPPSNDLEQAGLYSYHGGKNGFYLDGPQDFPSVWNYDITSAYPEAMRQLPDLEASSWKRVKQHHPGAHAIYCISGTYKACTYRGMQSHNGRWHPSGQVNGVWLTSYELDAMLLQGEFNLESLVGYELLGGSGGALAKYVDDFFYIKQTTSGPERETAKLLLNSLYGKFFQKQPVGIVGQYDLDNKRWITSDPDSDWDYEAGGLYHPAIASLITGFVRARIHGAEHRYGAIMTSTDGWFGFQPPDPKEMGNGLGKLKATQGRLRIWRERLYIFDGLDGERKYALHGFRGNVTELEESIPLVRGSYTYQGKQMITLKMSNTKHNGVIYAPGTFVMLPYTINI